MNMTIRTWSSIDNTIVIHLTWSNIFTLYNTHGIPRDLGTVFEGDTVAGYHFPQLAWPIPAALKDWAIALVRDSGQLASVRDLTRSN